MKFYGAGLLVFLDVFINNEKNLKKDILTKKEYFKDGKIIFIEFKDVNFMTKANGDLYLNNNFLTIDFETKLIEN